MLRNCNDFARNGQLIAFYFIDSPEDHGCQMPPRLQECNMPTKLPTTTGNRRMARQSPLRPHSSAAEADTGRHTFDRTRTTVRRRTKPARPIRSHAAHHSLRLKRAYERHAPGDGMRVLVDRLWPRGLRKEQLAVDFWLKELAPSEALRRWYGHEPSRWASFSDRYRAELTHRGELLQLLDELRRRGPLTLLYGARDAARNNAVVLREVLEERRAAADHPNRGSER
jgi:uncharacterized protein YeaO (DUF488 family)